jgi:hypothetical protein
MIVHYFPPSRPLADGQGALANARSRPSEGRLASAHRAGQSRAARCSSVMGIKMLGLSSIGPVREIGSLTPPYPALGSLAPNPPSPASLRNLRRFMMTHSQESILPPKINGDDLSAVPETSSIIYSY